MISLAKNNMILFYLSINVSGEVVLVWNGFGLEWFWFGIVLVWNGFGLKCEKV